METQQNHDNFEMRKYFPLTKVNQQDHTVYGIASCELPDKENEIADYIDTKKAFQEWAKEAQESTSASGQDISLGNIRYMHKLILAGKATKLKFDDDRKQVWLETTPAPPLSKEDPDIWPLLVGGFLRGFSIGGKYVKRVCNNCRKAITGHFCKHCNEDVAVRFSPSISETSYVDNPCLKEAVFTLVKSDGSTELKKFSNIPLAEVIEHQILPERKSMTKLESQLRQMIQKAGCKCACANCKDGDCANCTGETKCNMSAKAVKYLVSKDGENHLPYTNEDGQPNRRLCGAAFAALFAAGGHRGNKYEGPNKEQAKKKIKQVYAAQGWDLPSEKAEQASELIKEMLIDRIQQRAFGCDMAKGMYAISNFAHLCEELKQLWLYCDMEREYEGDESPATDELKEMFEQLLDATLLYVEEQISEEKEKHLAEKAYVAKFKEEVVEVA